MAKAIPTFTGKLTRNWSMQTRSKLNVSAVVTLSSKKSNNYWSVSKVWLLLHRENGTGCSAVRLAHLLWEQGVEGSNPFTPTKQIKPLKISTLLKFSMAFLFLKRNLGTWNFALFSTILHYHVAKSLQIPCKGGRPYNTLSVLRSRLLLLSSLFPKVPRVSYLCTRTR